MKDRQPDNVRGDTGKAIHQCLNPEVQHSLVCWVIWKFKCTYSEMSKRSTFFFFKLLTIVYANITSPVYSRRQTLHYGMCLKTV